MENDILDSLEDLGYVHALFARVSGPKLLAKGAGARTNTQASNIKIL